jgi:hypothetical protein
MARPTRYDAVRRGRAAAALGAALLLCLTDSARAQSVVTFATDAAGGRYFSVAINGGAARPYFPRCARLRAARAVRGSGKFAKAHDTRHACASDVCGWRRRPAYAARGSCAARN